MKLAAGYVVFDGLETLEASLRSIRLQVDIIIVSYQTTSWGGTVATPELIPTLTGLQNLGLIDELIEFKNFRPSSLISPAEVLQAKSFELVKRQGCLELAFKLGATHYLSMDADEFYRESEFSWAKTEIETFNLDATAVHYINYVTPTLHRGHARWRVPFIYRITSQSRHHASQFIFSGIDPTRGMIDDSYFKSRIFERSQISMHHMEMVRADLLSKYLASSRYFPDRNKLSEMADSIDSAKLTGLLQFKGAHLGDLDSITKSTPLISCENEFKIVF